MGVLAAHKVRDIGDDGLALDAKKQQEERVKAGKSSTGEDEETLKKRMDEAYKEHYDDYQKHRVWYQVSSPEALHYPCFLVVASAPMFTATLNDTNDDTHR